MKMRFLLFMFSFALIALGAHCEQIESKGASLERESFSSYAQYMEFLKLNALYTQIEEPLLVRQEIIKYKDENTEKAKDYVYCLFHKNGQCVQIKTAKNKMQYFFASPQGYWLYTNKLKTPLKISGSYKVEEHEIQDILKIDFQNEYKIIECDDLHIVLEKVSGKSAYKFIFFEAGGWKDAKEQSYSITLCDNKKNQVRRFVYHKGDVDGFTLFSQIDIYNLTFKREEHMEWHTLSVQEVSVPTSLFVFSKIKQLTEQMAHIIK